ncbi:glycosyltransferase [Dyella flava]|nr:glycosyltransferase [Dyella flava]
MIVRNEAHIMERCLGSALPLIDYACIVDTGSDDDTVAVIRTFLNKHGVACNIYRDTWRDFASNRNAALKWMHLRPDIDYCLMLDADEVVRYEPEFDIRRFKAQLQLDVYDVRLRSEGAECTRVALFENNIACYYRGKLHEFIEVPSGVTRGDAVGFYLDAVHDSARNRDAGKFLNDARVIEEAMVEETDPFMLSRYSFYLGQCYMDGGEFRRAIKAFHQRVRYGGCQQEVFISLLRIARLMVALGYREERVLHAYLQAWSACPERAEPLHDLAAYARVKKQFHWARLFSSFGLRLEKPAQGLFVESDLYDYKLLDEYATAAYGCGDSAGSLDACTHLLKRAALPAAERERILANAGMALARLG